MTDTPPELEAWLLKKYLERSPEERFKMAAEMFECARAIIVSTLPPGLTEEEKRRMIYERTYGEPAPWTLSAQSPPSPHPPEPPAPESD